MSEYFWAEGNLLGNYLYFEADTGRIIGEVSRVGMSGERSSASCYINPREPQYVLGQYINSKTAKKAIEKHIYQHNMIIDGNLLE